MRYDMGMYGQRLKVYLTSSSHRGFLGKVCQFHLFSSSTAPPLPVVKSVYASHLNTSTPWLTLPPELDPSTGRKVDRFLSVATNEIFKLDRKIALKVSEESRCFSSSRGWLVFVDSTDCSICLSNPFYDSPLVRLPSIETLPSVLGVKRSSHMHSTVIDQFIMLEYPYSSLKEKYRRRYSFANTRKLSRHFVNHLTLSCEPLNYSQEECIAMIIHEFKRPQHLHQLAFCRVGRDEAWTTLPDADIADFQTQPACGDKDNDVQLFYSMYSTLFHYGINAWEIPKPGRIPARRANFIYNRYGKKIHEEAIMGGLETSESDIRNMCSAKEYLVVDGKSVMLIVRHTGEHVGEDGTIHNHDPTYPDALYWRPDGSSIQVDPYQLNPKPIPYKTLRFDVYKVDMKNAKLEHVKYLGDRVVFLGLNQSFVLSACDFPGLKPNSIYFTDDSIGMIWDTSLPYGGHDMGIYNLEDNTIEPFLDELNTNKKIRPPPIWVAPNSSC